MARPFFALLSLSLLLSACTQRLICPAYQSAFIYDQSELRKKFSYFLEDSTPKILTASKTRYLIAEPVSYRKKLRSMQTVQMKDVNVVLPDSMKVGGEDGLMGEDGVVPGAELDLAARSVIDSTYIVDVPHDTTELAGDSVYVITKDKELRLLKYDFTDSLVYDESSGLYVTETPKYVVTDVRFNVEQDNYMWYLRKNLVLPDVKLSALMQTEDKSAPNKEKKGFLKNLFKRKKKDVVDSTAIEVPAKPADDFDYIDENEEVQPQEEVQAEPQKKKGLFSFLKKKDKAVQSAKDTEPKDTGPPVKEKEIEKKKKKEKKPKEEIKPEETEEEDDGF